MVYGPCGGLRPTSPCMVEENSRRSCSKKYPRPFNAQTMEGRESYPVYRRRETGTPTSAGVHAVMQPGARCAPHYAESRLGPLAQRPQAMDNRWVVPYNLWLVVKYNAHINMEVVASIVVVKYMFKCALALALSRFMPWPSSRCSNHGVCQVRVQGLRARGGGNRWRGRCRSSVAAGDQVGAGQAAGQQAGAAAARSGAPAQVDEIKLFQDCRCGHQGPGVCCLSTLVAPW